MKPIIRRLADQPWEGWPDDQVAIRGQVAWKNLLGDDPHEGADLILGVARLRKGESLEPHRHAQPETYFTLSGRGVVTIDGTAHPVEPGTTVFIPGDAEHQINNNNDEDLQILYTFAVDDFSKIVYRF